MRYFTQGLAEDDAGRKDLLMDIATEELSHLEVIGSIVGMLNKGAEGELTEAIEQESVWYRSLTDGGNDSHITSLLYGGGPALTNSAGVPWTAAYVDSIGEPSAACAAISRQRRRPKLCMSV
jgi:Mn-containing catalase